MLVAFLAVALTACGTEEAPGSGAGTSIEGTLGGDPELEGGCAWLDVAGQRYEVVWPEGYRVEFSPVRLLGPGGEVVAEEGDMLRVSGEEDPEAMSICMVGPMFRADGPPTRV